MRLSDYFQEIVNNIYLFSEADLIVLKNKLSDNDIKKLDELLNEALAYRLKSVVDKRAMPPSGDKHDYMSISIYHWPNPDTADGLPYIERDGKDNPESVHGDKESLRVVAYVTLLSGILYYITDDYKYLDILIKYNNFWFIDEKTRMNPNLKYGQCIPGINEGEPGGIIDYAACYGYSLNILYILKKNAMLPAEFYDGMKEWHEEFFNWILTSDRGIMQAARLNNQGSLNDLLIFNIARFIGRANGIKEAYDSKLIVRLEQQIDSEGKMPLELIRTKSKSYTTMGLKMLLESACLLMEYGYSYKGNKELLRAYSFVKDFYINNNWNFQQIKNFDPYRGYYILYLFSKVLGKKCPKLSYSSDEMHWGNILLKKLLED